MKLSDETMKAIKEITRTNYEINDDGNISLESAESLIEDLIAETIELKEQIKKIMDNPEEPDYDEVSKDIKLGIYD